MLFLYLCCPLFSVFWTRILACISFINVLKGYAWFGACYKLQRTFCYYFPWTPVSCFENIVSTFIDVKETNASFMVEHIHRFVGWIWWHICLIIATNRNSSGDSLNTFVTVTERIRNIIQHNLVHGNVCYIRTMWLGRYSNIFRLSWSKEKGGWYMVRCILELFTKFLYCYC